MSTYAGTPILESVLGYMVLYCTLVSGVYLAMYSFRPWWTTRVGRAMWTKALGNFLLLMLVTFRTMFGDYEYRLQLVFVAMILFSVGLTYLLVSLLRTPRIPPEADTK